ncbi:hypothetical protein INR49_020741 [Caranx melampygus]|nr:hypothetical protein INR49_020741 [Caranx melampygus]
MLSHPLRKQHQLRNVGTPLLYLYPTSNCKDPLASPPPTSKPTQAADIGLPTRKPVSHLHPTFKELDLQKDNSPLQTPPTTPSTSLSEDYFIERQPTLRQISTETQTTPTHTAAKMQL